MAIVMGPTPPGTGVMYEHFGAHSSKFTSPFITYFFIFPLFVFSLGSLFSTRLIPTSITTAPGLIQSPRTYSALPTAAIMMSAFRHFSAVSFVREWQHVTVPFIDCSSAQIGMPTMFDRPSTTQFFPLTVMSYRCSSSMQPAGVHATASGGSPPESHMLPTLRAWNPSASFSTAMAFRTSFVSMPSGSGSWTRMPWIMGSALSFLTSAMSSSCEIVSGRLRSTEWKPISATFSFFMRTYWALSGRSPTRTTARPGTQS
mmetsp:Transcript_2752/g.5584  ORF Transcript_2752/g.5584 Transcript_2752/m.5584 type:complete len:258 (-) Transcript_2752:276-1049(-)